jgi:superfamily II DNA or RNA helicase
MSATILRDYQEKIIDQVFDAWESGHNNVLVQSHTGSGKTVILTEIVKRFAQPTVIMAHRLELVSQLSLAMARAEIPHGLTSPAATIPDIVKLHLQNAPRHFFSPQAPVVVASVDTLIRRDMQWCNRVKLVVVDEAAHVLKDNKWGKAVTLFPNARVLLVTATPLRADGRGLGKQGDGIADVLIEGPPMRRLIQEGYLSPFRIFAPPNVLDVSQVKITASGDYSPKPLSEAVGKAHITGDIVEHYKRHANGGRGITFAVSVEAAQELAAAYNAAGVPAVCLHAGSGISERAAVMRQFRDGTIQQLVNVDILAEGVDVPAVSCVSLARPTASYGLHMQQLGRALRPAEGKQYAVILDHVGNVMKHGMPDVPRVWTLESRERKSKGANTGTIPLRTCLNTECVAVFERNLDRCPYCKHPVPLSSQRATPAQVEGNLLELESEALTALTKEIKRIEGAPLIPREVSGIVASSIIKKHHARQDAQRVLRDVIAAWAGVWHAEGESDAEILRRFWYQFGIDTLTAQTLPASEALKLADKIQERPEYVKKKIKNPCKRLSWQHLNNAKPKAKPYKLWDGVGMYLLVLPTGDRFWRLNYRFDGQRTLGKYPELDMSTARAMREEARTILERRLSVYEQERKKAQRKEVDVKIKDHWKKNITDEKLKSVIQIWIRRRCTNLPQGMDIEEYFKLNSGMTLGQALCLDPKSPQAIKMYNCLCEALDLATDTLETC